MQSFYTEEEIRKMSNDRCDSVLCNVIIENNYPKARIHLFDDTCFCISPTKNCIEKFDDFQEKIRIVLVVTMF